MSTYKTPRCVALAQAEVEYERSQHERAMDLLRLAGETDRAVLSWAEAAEEIASAYVACSAAVARKAQG